MAEKKRVGLYGGTFSPPHRGHVNAAAEFVREMELDVLYVMPANIPPHKEVVNPVPAEDRLHMCRVAFREVERAVISDYEIRKSGVSYTVDTLRYLMSEDIELFMLCGDDMMLTLDRWREYEEIFRLTSIVCMRRYDTDGVALTEKKTEYEEKYGARVSFIMTPPIPVSSTEIREMIKNGSDSVKKYLHPDVIEFIGEKGLYAE